MLLLRRSSSALLLFTLVGGACAQEPPFIDPDSFLGTDTQKIQSAIQAAVSHLGGSSLGGNCTIRLRWRGKPWVVTDTINVLPKEYRDGTGHFVSLNIIGDPVWNLIEYRGPSNRAVFHCEGLKNSSWKNVGIRVMNVDPLYRYTNKSGIVGIHLATTAGSESTSNNVFESCRVQFDNGSYYVSKSVGFWLDGGTAGGPQYDVSVNKFDSCTAYFDPIGATQSAKCQNAIDRGNVGYWISGANNLNNEFMNCGNVGMERGFRCRANSSWTGYMPGNYGTGGSSSSFYSCGASYCGLVFDLKGGYSFNIYGGRSELCAGYIMHGAATPSSPEGAVGTLSVTGGTADGMFPALVVPGAKPAGILIGLISCSQCTMSGLNVRWQGTGDPAVLFSIKHNNDAATGRLIWNGGGFQGIDMDNLRPLQGSLSWIIATDGLRRSS